MAARLRGGRQTAHDGPRPAGRHAAGGSLARESLKYPPPATFLHSSTTWRAPTAPRPTVSTSTRSGPTDADPRRSALLAYPFGLRPTSASRGFFRRGGVPDNSRPTHASGLFVEAFLQSSTGRSRRRGPPPPADGRPRAPLRARDDLHRARPRRESTGRATRLRRARRALKQIAGAMLGAQGLSAPPTARRDSAEPVAPTQGMAERALVRKSVERPRPARPHSRQGLIGAATSTLWKTRRSGERDQG